MALGNFWNKIRQLYRRFAPRVTRPGPVPTTTRMPTVQPVPAPTVPQPPTTPPVGPLDVATVLDTIVQAGRNRRVLELTYDGVSRLVEPYSFRDRGTGRLFYGYCSIHARIHSFKPEKVEAIKMTEFTYAPRWEVEM